MAPNKIENSIKEKLDGRRLQPSPDAWSKLSERLDQQEKKQNNFPIWWLGIAASVVGVLLVVTQFYNQDSAEPKKEVVVTPHIIKQDENEQITVIDSPDVLYEQEETRVQVKKQDLETNKVLKKQHKVEEVVAENKIKVPKLNSAIKIPEQVIIEELTLEEQKFQEVVAQVQQLKETDTHVTDATIDALLHEAQKEISLRKMYNESTGMVDANALLQDVEADLEKSFRDKVFEALKENYITIKTAVAQRND